jgi:large subunit ribosomal protein L18
VRGTSVRPRLAVHKSLSQTYASVVDDVRGVVLTGASTMQVDGAGTKMEKAARLGELIASRAKDKGITTVVFDRSGYPYHGRVKALAEKRP